MDYYNKASEYIKYIREITSGRELFAYVLSFGCQQNEADSEKIRGIAEQIGYKITDKYEIADLIIVNTCAIREHAEEKALSMLGNFKAIKRRKPELILGVCGCMSAEPHAVELLKRDFHYVNFTLQPNMLDELPRLIYYSLAENKRLFVLGDSESEIAEGVPTKRTYKHKAWVSIMYGCNNFCSYCIVPYVRGRERSRSSYDILEECRELVLDGCKEITLLGQNVNSYSSEIDFPELLEEIANIEGDFIIRFMTSHPKDVSDRLIEVMATHKSKIAPYFHLPLQSGSDRILKAMNRRYDRDRFLAIAKKLKKNIPEICLSTDVIIGFPGESESDFEDTLLVLREIEFDIVYAFKFSKRVGTPAANMDGEVESSVVDERMARLLSMQDEISLKKNIPYENRVERVLVDSVSKKNGTLSARTSSNKLVHFVGDESAIGEFRLVRIEKAKAFELLGKEIKE